VVDFGLRYFDVGYGSSFKKWLKGDEHLPYNSWGNGSAMRVSPIAFALDKESLMILNKELNLVERYGVDTSFFNKLKKENMK
jgi:ADP-ribosylglycohydrolase